MSPRIALALTAGLFLAACGNAGDSAAEAHGAGGAASATSASTNWSDATLNATKVDYFFNSIEKIGNYAMAHRDANMDAFSMNADESEADYARRVNADPQLRKMFAAVDVDPARFANANGTLIGAMFGVGLAGDKVDKAKMPQAAQYYIAHKAQIDARMAALQKKSETMAKQMGGDDSE